MLVQKEYYADGLGQIHFAGNMVRFDFVTLEPAGDGLPPVPQKKVRIIMPIQGFLGAFDSMQKLIDRLVDAGILLKKEPERNFKLIPAHSPEKEESSSETTKRPAKAPAKAAKKNAKKKPNVKE